ncbi:MAG: flagellar filament capping protein FliD [Lachnospiraceae bacterium]|nr:flagellar filament capping protein FliD [Lachnospiraceae bacterium]
MQRTDSLWLTGEQSVCGMICGQFPVKQGGDYMVSSVYNYYLSTYANKEVSKYDTHKKSELRDVYYSMVKVNRKSPLYKFTNMPKVQKYAIDIKETARAFKNVAASLTNQDGSIAGFSKKKAESSNENIVSAVYIGNEEAEEGAGFDIYVKNMAKPQVNVSNFMNPSEVSIKEGSYSFDLSIGKYTYEFSFDVTEGRKNRDVQKQITNLINRADIGIHASVKEGSSGDTAIEIVSDSTGLGEKGAVKTFEIQNNDKSESGDIVKMMGLDRTEIMPENAVFTINGDEYSTAANVFISNNFRVTLNGESGESEPVRIDLKPDFDAMIENVSELIDAYNSMIDMAKSHADDSENSDKLLNEIQRVANYYKDGLESSGFMVREDGYIELDESLLVQSAEDGTLNDGLEQLNSLKKALVNKSNDMSLDPMKYVNKKLIAYPNPLRNFMNPYVSSLYSGMMFNGFI